MVRNSVLSRLRTFEHVEVARRPSSASCLASCLRKWRQVVDRTVGLVTAVAVPTQGTGLESRVSRWSRHHGLHGAIPEKAQLIGQASHRAWLPDSKCRIAWAVASRMSCPADSNHADVPSLRDMSGRRACSRRVIKAGRFHAFGGSIGHHLLQQCSRSDAPVETSFENVRDLAVQAGRLSAWVKSFAGGP